MVDSNCNYITYHHHQAQYQVMGHQQSLIFYIFSIQCNGCSGVALFHLSLVNPAKLCRAFFSIFTSFWCKCQPGWKKRNWPDSDSFETWRLIRAIPHHQLPCPSLSSRHLSTSPYHPLSSSIFWSVFPHHQLPCPLSSRHLSPYHLLISFPFNMTSSYCFWILLSCYPCHRYCALTGWSSKHQQEKWQTHLPFLFLDQGSHWSAICCFFSVNFYEQAVCWLGRAPHTGWRR